MSALAEFVLDSFHQAGGIIEPPAYNAYEILLPEETARRWNVPAYLHLAFADAPPADLAGIEDVTIVGYGHPLVETLVEEARTDPACALAYVNDLRLDKRGLLALARRTFALRNARLSEVKRKGESPTLCHYVRFNFKAALITDEKHEQLVSVMMDAQAGFSVPELTHIEELIRLEEKSTLEHLPPAPVRWLPGHQVLSRPVLEGLLERAARAALDELAAPLETLRRRAARYLELDRARLTGYYDDIARDLKRRIKRASDEARRASLEDKLAATQVERQDKLTDIEAKYHLRVELELINLQVVAQPKILLPVCIANRTTSVERIIAWDPLLHRLQPLACDVCGRPAMRLTLCTSGHLAHADCLSPEQCVDCKRVYCRLCTDQMGHCAVCKRPVCLHSLNRCDVCGRATCREHVALCHAGPNQTAQLPPPEPPEPAWPPPPVEDEKQEPSAPPSPPESSKTKHKRTRAAKQMVSHPAKKPSRTPAPYKIEVYVEPDVPMVNAFVLAKGKKQFAVRSWELTDRGILVTCRCEKWRRCPADGMVLKPADAQDIERQIEAQIEDLRREYGISARLVFRHAVIHGALRQVPRVALRGKWKMER